MALDDVLRQRVEDGMDVVSHDLQKAIAHPSPENLSTLKESTDDLMRALGRVVLEIAKLLPPTE